MKPTFLSLTKPAIVCIFAGRTVQENIATIRNGEFEGAAAFAVHLHPMGREALTEENFQRIAGATRKPVMFLLYRGDMATWPKAFTDDERAECLKMAVRAGVACIDITADMFAPSEREFTRDPKVIRKQMAFIEEIREIGGEVVMSSHIINTALTTSEVIEHMLEVQRRGADIAKIVTSADTDAQFVEAVETTLALWRAMDIPFIHLIAGAFARPHRFLAPQLGNAITFCVDRYTDIFTTVQPPVHAMKAVLDNTCWHIDN